MTRLLVWAILFIKWIIRVPIVLMFVIITPLLVLLKWSFSDDTLIETAGHWLDFITDFARGEL